MKIDLDRLIWTAKQKGEVMKISYKVIRVRCRMFSDRVYEGLSDDEIRDFELLSIKAHLLRKTFEKFAKEHSCGECCKRAFCMCPGVPYEECFL